MTRSKIKDQIREVIGGVLDIPPVEVPDVSNMPHALFMDSIIVLEILVELENVFSVEIDDENVLEILDSVDSTTDYIEQKLTSATL